MTACECGEPSTGRPVYLSTGTVFPCSDCREAITRWARIEVRRGSRAQQVQVRQTTQPNHPWGKVLA